ncbi:hypothetical protein [Clostridium sp.]|uniref:hypothetical protein n=1 Tax=Clostridium sp. TaxID=1506 RepID=UPI003D6C9EE9
MKYFTLDLWRGSNSDSEKIIDESIAEWNKNAKAYNEVFESIQNRFSKKFLKSYLCNERFHDYTIKNIKINNKDKRGENPMSIDIFITYSLITWKITYKNVVKFSINYEQWEGEGTCIGFDDWGYDEFIPVNEDILSHEILFVSGATILIYFKNKKILLSKVNDD